MSPKQPRVKGQGLTLYRWHWWADVPPKRHDEIWALPVSTVNGEPSVKYRGIFINDESPGMDSWVHEKFGPKFDARLYHYIFELLLRLKANFMWPAMWRGYPYPGRSFFVDDPKNQALADTYGIVMGTSHHEPMQRAMNEWSTTQPDGTWDWDRNRAKVTQYFEEGAERARPYESYFTLGMRGEGDNPINGSDPPRILREVLATQRDIIKKNYGREDGVLRMYSEIPCWPSLTWLQSSWPSTTKSKNTMTMGWRFRRMLLSCSPTTTLARSVGSQMRTNSRDLVDPGSVHIRVLLLHSLTRVQFYYHFQYTGYPRCYRWMNSNTLVWSPICVSSTPDTDARTGQGVASASACV